MKTFLIGIIFLGLTSLGYSQVNEDTKVKEEALSAVTLSTLNLNYLNKVHNDFNPEHVKALENKAAQYNITESPLFSVGKFEAYEVIFEQSKSRIIANYDSKGKIISSFERFYNIMLPPDVRSAIHNEYPDWTVHKDVYLVSYYRFRDVKKIYKIQIRKDKQKKNLKVDVEGKIM